MKLILFHSYNVPKSGYVTISTYWAARVPSSVLSTFMPMLSPLIITPTLWHKTEPYFPTRKTAEQKGYLAQGSLFKKRWVQNLNSKIWMQSLVFPTGPLHVLYRWLKQMVKSWPSSLEQVGSNFLTHKQQQLLSHRATPWPLYTDKMKRHPNALSNEE